uniref:Uncharacterized protein n=1 Tax=Rhizophora mucronata TaxID=61149 RepID=A0A2P2JLB2_RHIMU
MELSSSEFIVRMQQSPCLSRVTTNLRLSPPCIMARKSFTTTALTIVKFSQQMKPAALLTKPLLDSTYYDLGCLGMSFTNFVSPVILF